MAKINWENESEHREISLEWIQMKTLVYTGTCKCRLGWQKKTDFWKPCYPSPGAMYKSLCNGEVVYFSSCLLFLIKCIYTMFKAQIMHRSSMYSTNIDKSLFHFKLKWTLYPYEPLSSVTMVTLSTSVTLSTAGPVSRFIKLTMWCQPVISTNNSI